MKSSEKKETPKAVFNEDYLKSLLGKRAIYENCIGLIHGVDLVKGKIMLLGQWILLTECTLDD